MPFLSDPRRILLAAGTIVFAAFSGAASAQPPAARGTVDYDGGKAIPAGELTITVEPGDAVGKALAGPLRITSDGSQRRLDFSLSAPAARGAGGQVVATLTRPGDGWLLARGSADLTHAGPVAITLFTVMY